MNNQYVLPPSPQHAVLKRIYPWDEYNGAMVLQWLYTQAKNTGFIGSFEDFKSRYGIYIEEVDEQGIHYLLEPYEGSYHITPLVEIEQVLRTKNKILDQDIVIDPIPADLLGKRPLYRGPYTVTPKHLTTVLRTESTLLDQNIVIEPIPYRTELNAAGGYTAYIA